MINTHLFIIYLFESTLQISNQCENPTKQRQEYCDSFTQRCDEPHFKTWFLSRTKLEQ